MKFFGFELKRARPARKPKPIAIRNYLGGEDSRLLQDWPTIGQSADAELFQYFEALRNRARHLAKNNDYAKRYLALLKTNVVGPKGVVLQARTKNANGILDKADNDYIESNFKRWGRAGSATIDGRLSFIDCQNAFVETLARDGEVIYRHIYGDNVNPYRYAIQFIEPDRLDHRLNGKAKNGNIIRLGVELNQWRRPVAFYLLPEDRNSSLYVASQNYTVGGDHVRVSADELRHVYQPNRINQTRGVTWLHTAMRRLHLLNGYEESEVVAARTAAAKMGFFKSQTGEEFTGDDLDGETDGANRKVPIMNAEPGTFEELPDGVDFVGWNPDHPTSAFEAFILANLRGVASGLGVSYVSLANDLRGVSYSSIRQGVLEERDFYRTVQRFLIDHFLSDVYEQWIRTAISVGALRLPPVKIDKFLNVVWRPRGWSWVDPLKEVEAHKRAVGEGFRSMSDVMAEQGKDAPEVFNELSDEAKIAAAIGLKIPNLQALIGGTNGTAND